MANINNAFTAPQGISLDDVVGIFHSTVDPTIAGESAPVGSLLLSTNGNVYRKVSAGDTGWVAIDNEYPIYYHNGAVTQTFSAATTLLFPTALLSNANYTYSAGSVVVINAGIYEICFDASYTISSNNRTISSTETRVNGVAVGGSKAFGNHGNNVEGQQTATSKVRLPLAANDVVTIVGVRLTGTANLITVANGCRLNIKRCYAG